MNLDLLQAELIRDEGLRLKPYTDTVGKLTVGVGRNLTDRGLLADEVKVIGIRGAFPAVDTPLLGLECCTLIGPSGLTNDEAMMLLGNDIQHVSTQLDGRFPWWRSMTDARQRALVNFGFAGVGTVAGFPKMLAALKAGDYAAAADELLNSRYAEQVGERAQRLAAMIREG